MLKRLIKIRLLAFWDSLFRGTSKSKAKSKNSTFKKILIFIFAIYILFSLSFSIGGMFLQLAQQLIPLDFDWLYFSYIAIIVLLFNFFGSVFTVTRQIHEAKDNDLLLSMPIKPRDILASRIGSILILSYINTLIFALPAYIVYLFTAGIRPIGIIFFALSTLALPFLALSLSILIGWLISLITMRFKRKDLFSSFFMLGFFLVYMFFMMNINSYMQKLVEKGEEIGMVLKRFFPPIYSYGLAITNINIVHLLIFMAFCFLPFALIFFLLLKTFIPLATIKKSAPDILYKEKEMKPLSIPSSLLKKEFNRFFTLPSYILNSALGVLFEVFFSLYIIFNSDKILIALGGLLSFDIKGILPFALGIILSSMSIMNCTTAPSLSLEGSSIQLLKSLPIRARDIFNAKIRLNIILGTPSILLAAVASTLAFNLSLPQALLIFIVPFVSQSFIAVFGMFINILLPRFDWRNETQAIKQSASVVITMFAGMAILLAPAGIGFLILQKLSAELALLFIGLSLTALTLIFYWYIYSKGQARLDKMQ